MSGVSNSDSGISTSTIDRRKGTSSQTQATCLQSTLPLVLVPVSESDHDSQATQIYESDDSQTTQIYESEDSQKTQIYESEDSQKTQIYESEDSQ